MLITFTAQISIVGGKGCLCSHETGSKKESIHFLQTAAIKNTQSNEYI